jgi:hypothetical protein
LFDEFGFFLIILLFRDRLPSHANWVDTAHENSFSLSGNRELTGDHSLLNQSKIEARSLLFNFSLNCKTTMTPTITSNEGTLNSASAVLEISATNPEYNQPALRTKQASSLGGAASIRIKG